MSTQFNVRAQTTTPMTGDAADAIVDALAEFYPAVGRSMFARTEVVFTITAESIRQAIRVGYALLEDAIAPHFIVSIEVLPTEEFDREHALEPIPELISVTEAAAALGVTRQAVLQRIESGSLPATRIGTAWAVPRSAVNG